MQIRPLFSAQPQQQPQPAPVPGQPRKSPGSNPIPQPVVPGGKIGDGCEIPGIGSRQKNDPSSDIVPEDGPGLRTCFA